MTPFTDLAPQHRLREPSRAECAAADEAFAQELAALRGGACHALTDDLGDLLDKRVCDWRADDKPTLDRIFDLLSEAQSLAATLP
jgi:hypothetical protein